MKVIINDKEYELVEGIVQKKWSPVIDSLYIRDNNVKEFACMYAEMFSLKENTENFTKESISLLPLNLMILSKLNLEGKELELTMDETLINIDQLSVKIKQDELFSLSEVLKQSDIISHIESILINTLANKINQELETGTKLTIQHLAESIMIIHEKGYDAKVVLKTKYKVS